MPRVTGTLSNENSGETQAWLYQRGPRDHLNLSLPDEPPIPLFEEEQFATDNETDNFAEGEDAQHGVSLSGTHRTHVG